MRHSQFLKASTNTMKSAPSFRKTSLLFVFFISILTIGQISASPEQEHRYNEVFTEDGQVREHYSAILPAWANRVHRMAQYEQETFKEFKRGRQDSNAIGDLPRMIPKQEYDIIVRGVHQRERAIQAFLHDHYSGQKGYARAGIISTELVDSIVIRNGEHGYKNIIDGNTPMNFLYGPDLIRGPDGKLRALEDNIGFVGGFGDILLAQQMSERLYPEIAKTYDFARADVFYHQLIQRYQEQAKKFGGKVVMYTDPNATDDSEEVRTMELFEKLGMEVLSPKSERRLVYEKNGVFVQGEDGKNREKVGFILLNLEHSDADPFHPATFEKAILDGAAGLLSDKKSGESKKLRAAVHEALMSYDPIHGDKIAQLKKLKSLLKDTAYRVNLTEGSRRNRGLVDAILQGHVGSSYSPGAEFVGDKQMYTYLEKFIRYYLNEEPIIKNVETYMFNASGTQKVDEQVLDRVFGKDRKGTHFEDWVLKPVDGRGGDGIIFGKETKLDQIPEIIAKIKASPQRLQAQRNTPPSLIPGNRIIDTRALTYSTREGGIVSPVPWSRAATLDKSRLINVSAGGAVLGVFVVEKKSLTSSREALPSNTVRCRALFSPRH